MEKTKFRDKGLEIPLKGAQKSKILGYVIKKLEKFPQKFIHYKKFIKLHEHSNCVHIKLVVVARKNKNS